MASFLHHADMRIATLAQILPSAQLRISASYAKSGVYGYGGDNMREYIVKIKPLTPIWTGDVNRKCKTLRETGVLGSLRWWYEVLIRGLGGSACDPTSDAKCPDKNGNRCDACELFGCTGWSRKFRLEVEKQDSEITLNFIELRKMKNIEWGLLNKTLQIIADFGAIGGKIAESKYGLVKIEHNDLKDFSLDKIELEGYLKKEGSNIENPNIRRFIFINHNLKYEIVKDLKKNLPFIKGKPGKGKRYFYKTFNRKPYRFFAYAENDGEYRQIIEFLRSKSVQFVEGKRFLEGLV